MSMNNNDSVASFLKSRHDTAFSFEMLPPLRGNSIESSFKSIEPLLELKPEYVNITTHRREISYIQGGNGSYRQTSARKRPGTIAVAALLRERYGVRPVPHVICGDFSRGEIEDQLIDLSYLGITDILALRGDRERAESVFTTSPDGHKYAISLIDQIVDFNNGKMIDGSEGSPLEHRFSFGVAGYPEKHEESMNLSTDIRYLKEKVERGASYIVTQMFFDNSQYFAFVKRCREYGITVPIIPGIKPLSSLRQQSLLPRIFHIDIPEGLSDDFLKCRTNDDVRRLGVEWATAQVKELKDSGVPCIHFYAMHATQSIVDIVKNIF